MKRPWLVFAIGIAVGALLLWYALEGIELEAVWSALKVANYWWLVPAMAIYFVSVWFRSWRWGYLLRATCWFFTQSCWFR